ncbi:hypothetical protein JL687_04120, partial [Mycoplasmopsis bovis]|nr:hypothetical protein [Mycoplasmopsis bovis]MCA8844793.1 hypothetical protein [Mycoplasmopsis bovis]MCA8849414.1 hypothetical protein [Mycoplasmopsis bovis]
PGPGAGTNPQQVTPAKPGPGASGKRSWDPKSQEFRRKIKEIGNLHK